MPPVPRKVILLGAVALVAALAAWLLSRTRVTADGDRVSIRQGANAIEGRLAPAETLELVLKDEGEGSFSGDAFVSVLPLETADRLRARYGDLFRCSSEGADAAARAMEGVVLVAAGRGAAREIGRALALVRESRTPVVRATASRIRVGERTYLGMDVEDSSGIRLLYVDDFEIERPDF